MPIDYSKYPKNWFSEIRPSVLARADNKCEKCRVPNHSVILRGEWNGVPAFQDMDGNIFDAESGDKIGEDYLGEVDQSGKKQTIKIVLTIAHLDHNPDNNDLSNLQALCQRHHLAIDSELHRENARKTRNRKRGQTSLFE